MISIKQTYLQSIKLIQLTAYLFWSYVRIFYAYDRSKYLFTHIHNRFLFDRPKIPSIPLEKLCDSFTPVQIYNGAINLATDIGGEKARAYMKVSELVALSCLAKCRSPKIAFEFGTYRAGTTYNLYLNTLPHCQIYTLDQSQVSLIDERIQSLFASGRVHALRGNSLLYDFSNFYGRVDFILIDAGHSYHEVKSDTENALRMLSPGGVVLWHDYQQATPGVFKFINEISKKKDIIHIADTAFAYFSIPHLYLTLPEFRNGL